MHVLLQVAVFLLFLFFGLLGISLLQKSFNLKVAAVMACVLLIALGSGFLGLKSKDKNDFRREMVKVGTFLDFGNYDKAIHLLNKRTTSKEQESLLLLYKARLYTLNGNPSLGAHYYNAVAQKLSEGEYDRHKQIDKDALDDELTAFKDSYQQDDKTSKAFTAYIQNAGLNPADYGITEAELTSLGENSSHTSSEANQDELQQIITDNIRQEVDTLTASNDNLQKEAEKAGLIQQIDTLNDAGLQAYQKTLPDGTTVEVSMADLCDDALDLYEGDRYDPELNLALVKALISDGRFDEVKEVLMKLPTAENMAIMSDLYINGKIDGDQLEKMVKILPESAYERVINQYETVFDQYDGDNPALTDRLKERINAIQRERENPELAGLKDSIRHKLMTDEKDKQQLNLELAKIAVYFDDKTSADAYIEETLSNIEHIKDEDIVAGLSRLSSLSVNTENSFEALKEIPAQVNALSSNILPVNIPQDGNTQFEAHISSYFTKKAVEVNITKIDISNYPSIKATVQVGDGGAIDSDEGGLNKKDFRIFDTGMGIDSFNLKKIDVKRSNIVLCVDASPSMESAFETVKQVCLQFARDIAKNERISLVAFDSGIVSDFGFEKDVNTLEASINSLYMGSGTNIHNALLTSLNKLTMAEGENNIIILISDGGNNNAVSPDEMDYLSSLIQKTGTTVYTIGLGEEVAGEYLNEVAKRGNGRFIFSPGSNQLEAFYDFLHNQIQNQYILSYKVENQDIEDRYIDVELPDRQSKGHRKYSLYTMVGLNQEEQLAKIEEMDASSLQVKGLDKNCIVKSELSQVEVSLVGSGFSTLSEKDIELKIDNYGHIKADKLKIKDNEHITFKLPANIPAGTYSITVRMKDRLFTLSNELEIIKSGTVQTLQFGPYKITANEIKIVGPNKRVARGNVQINNFLRFKGELTIEGNVDQDHYLNLTPSGESYIAFSKGNNTNWLVENVYLKYNLNMNLFQWGTFSINRDGDPSQINLANQIDIDLIKLPEPQISFLPDQVEIQTNRINMNLPMQKYIFLAAGAKPISFKGDTKVLVTGEQIAYAGSFELETDGSLLGRKLLNVFELKKLKGSANSMKGDFTFEVGIGLTAWRDEANQFGLALGWKQCKFDEFLITLPFEINALTTPVPVTIKEMGGGAGNLSTIDSLNWDALKKIKYILQTDVVVAKATEVIPFIGDIDWLKDKIPGLLLIDDARIDLTIEKFALNFNAKLKLFEEFDIGAVEMAIGNYEFKQSLLNMGPRGVVGFHFKNTQGIDLDFEKLKIKLQAALGIDINNLGMFGQASGVAAAEIDVLGINKKYSFDGDALIAVHQNTDNRTQFTIGIRGRDLENGKAADFRFYVNSQKIGIVGIDIPFTEKNTLEFNF